uniref:Uncharacterized protein n=1 Tax=Timema bartmani TaxID=61472 RepID=A0A7R9I4E5_9NEOP|nr:unnamed protein product [Timema bartmani]
MHHGPTYCVCIAAPLRGDRFIVAHQDIGLILTVAFVVTAQAGPITKEYTKHTDKGGFTSSSDIPKHNSSPWLPYPTESIVNVKNKHGNHYKLTTGPGQSSVALVEYGPNGVSSVITSGSSKPILVEPGYNYHLVDTSSDAGGLKEPEVLVSAKTPQDTAFKSHDVPNKMQNTDDGINYQRNSSPKPWNNVLQSSVLSFPFQKLQEFKPLLKRSSSDLYDREEKDDEPMISIMSSVDKNGIKTISRNGRGTFQLQHSTNKKCDEDDHSFPIHTWKGDNSEEDTYPKNHKEGHYGVETKCCFPHGPKGEISREEFNNDFIMQYGGHHIGSSGSVKKSDYFPYDPKKEINIFIDKFIDDSCFKNKHGGNYEDFYEDHKMYDYSFDKSKNEPKKKFDECEDFKTKDDDHHFGSDKSDDPKEEINKATKKSKDDECCQIKYEEHRPDPYEHGINKEVIISDNVAYRDGCNFIHHMNNRNLAAPNNGITNELYGSYADSPSKYVIHDPIFDVKDKEDHKYVPNGQKLVQVIELGNDLNCPVHEVGSKSSTQSMNGTIFCQADLGGLPVYQARGSVVRTEDDPSVWRVDYISGGRARFNAPSCLGAQLSWRPVGRARLAKPSCPRPLIPSQQYRNLEESRGSEPPFACRESGKLFRKSHPHPTEIRTSISPSSAVELNTTSALANYATEAGGSSDHLQNSYLDLDLPFAFIYRYKLIWSKRVDHCEKHPFKKIEDSER